MAEDDTGGELFVVDNSVSGWTGLRYLREWCELATSFDVATGFFEIGALLDLDSDWQKLDKVRIRGPYSAAEVEPLGAELTKR